MSRPSPEAERAALAAALEGTARGDRAQFAEVYRRTAAKLLGVCLRIFPERSEAEDALQDVYLQVWQKAARFDPARASPITWLVTLARNRAIDRARRTGRVATTPIEAIAEPADESASALDGLLAGEDETRLAHCLAQLDGGDRGMILTAFYQQVSYPDLAARSGTPLGTVKSRIRRALLRLRECLQ